jgi:hypothetical protein
MYTFEKYFPIVAVTLLIKLPGRNFVYLFSFDLFNVAFTNSYLIVRFEVFPEDDIVLSYFIVRIFWLWHATFFLT